MGTIMLSIILLVYVTTIHSLQLPFLNVNFAIPSFSKLPFSIPSSVTDNPVFEQPEDFDEGSIFKDLLAVPVMGMENEKYTQTKNNTIEKDGYKITTINKTGPGFFSYITKMISDGKNKNNNTFPGGLMDLKMMGGFKPLGLLNPFAIKKLKCKKCSAEQFCNHFTGKCEKRFEKGGACWRKKQCASDLRCVWGNCNEAKAGAIGTFCSKKSPCAGEAICYGADESHRTCHAPLGEGILCGDLMDDVFKNPLLPKQQKQDENLPCEDGLKCAATSGMGIKRCVLKSFVNKPREIAEDKKESRDDDKSEPKDDDQNDDPKNDDNSGDDNDDDKKIDDEGRIPVEAGPNKNKKKKHTSKSED